MGNSCIFSLTNGCRWETFHFFVIQKISIEGHFNPMLNVLPLELPGPDYFYLMYFNTGCGDKLKYNNKVFICKGSMWNANCAQTTAVIFGKWMFLRNNNFFCVRECLIPGELEHPFVGFILNVLLFEVVLPAVPLYQQERSMSRAVRESFHKSLGSS